MINWTLILVAIITAFPPTLVAFFSYAKSKENALAIEKVHVAVNSKMDKLLATSNAVAKAEGKVEGRNEK